MTLLPGRGGYLHVASDTLGAPSPNWARCSSSIGSFGVKSWCPSLYCHWHVGVNVIMFIQDNIHVLRQYYNWVQSHPISPNLTQSQPISFNFTQSHPISSNLTQSHPISSNLTQFHPISANLTQSHPISPNLTQSHPIITNNFIELDLFELICICAAAWAQAVLL